MPPYGNPISTLYLNRVSQRYLPLNETGVTQIVSLQSDAYIIRCHRISLLGSIEEGPPHRHSANASADCAGELAQITFLVNMGF